MNNHNAVCLFVCLLQELVSLLLTGEATSNVFNGEMDLGKDKEKVVTCTVCLQRHHNVAFSAFILGLHGFCVSYCYIRTRMYQSQLVLFVI